MPAGRRRLTVANVLVVPAFELRDPITLFIDMETSNASLSHLRFTHDTLRSTQGACRRQSARRNGQAVLRRLVARTPAAKRNTTPVARLKSVARRGCCNHAFARAADKA